MLIKLLFCILFGYNKTQIEYNKCRIPFKPRVLDGYFLMKYSEGVLPN